MLNRSIQTKPVGNNNPTDGFDPMYEWACDLFPKYRSITGDGLRKTLSYFKKILPEMKICAIESGAKVFDWVVPNEWNIIDAYIEDINGNKIMEFKKHNLHVVGYSEPIDKWVSLEELDKHLFSVPSEPYAIPYVTSYYEKTWGFCLPHNQRKLLKEGKYHVVINSSFKKGVLNYGELIIKGRSKKEILLSTYVCHPSMANNELSGPVLTASISRYLSRVNNRYTYRILFLPETIGSISYLSNNLNNMKKNIIAGYVLSCVGDDRGFSVIKSRNNNSISDRVLIQTLKQYCKTPKVYSFLDRGSDERQYCSPGVDLPICGFSRSKYATFPEYHTSFDDLSLITQKALEDSYSVIIDAISIIENNYIYKSSVLCEPQLGKRGLYHKISVSNTGINYEKTNVNLIMDFIAYTDGSNDLISIAEKLDCNPVDLLKISKLLCKERLIINTEIDTK